MECGLAVTVTPRTRRCVGGVPAETEAVGALLHVSLPGVRAGATPPPARPPGSLHLTPRGPVPAALWDSIEI